VVNPTQFGYNTAYDTAQFSMKYNLRTLVTAVAVNLGFMPLEALQEVFTVFNSQCSLATVGLTTSSSGYCQITYLGVTFEIHTYIDSRYDEMSPIFCLIRTSRAYDSAKDKFENLCLLRMRGAFVYPYFNHMGSTAFLAKTGSSNSTFFDPSYSCTCAQGSYSSDYLDLSSNFQKGTTAFKYKIRGSQKTEKYCNVFDLIHGFVIMSDKKVGSDGKVSSDTTANYVLSKILQMASANTPNDLANYAYIAGFMSLRLSYGIQILDKPPDNNGWFTLKAMYNAQLNPLQFCNGYPSSKNSASGLDYTGQDVFANPRCSIFAMNTFDMAEPSINNDHMNVMNPHCTDEFSFPETSWARNATWRYDTNDVPVASNQMGGLGAINVPPVKLTQDYYICFNSLTTSLALAFGSSAGTAGIAGTVVVTLMVSLISAGWFKKKGEGGEDKHHQGGISQGAVMMMGMFGTGVAIEASSKR